MAQQYIFTMRGLRKVVPPNRVILDGMARAGLHADPAHMHENAVTADDGARASQAILATPTPPTAIVCAVDMAALGVFRAAEQRGLTVGTDLSVIGYDGIPDGAFSTPPLTTFAVDHIRSGRRLSEILIQRIRGAAADTLRETVRATFLDRGSAGPPRKT